MSKLGSSFHSGKRLQKLRELQGLSLVDLSQVLSIDSMQLQTWEKDGVPRERIVDCCDYFEVPESVFNQQIDTQIGLTQLIEKALFSNTNDSLQQRIDANFATQNPLLDLSDLGLNEIPAAVYHFAWLQTLNLSHNKIKQISPQQFIQLSQLSQLANIDLSHNQLDLVSATITAMPFQSVNFKGNPLKFQPNLLDTEMNLVAFKRYLAHYQVNIALMETSAGEIADQLNDLSMVIEKYQPLILTTLEEASEFLTDYKNKINCLIYLSASPPTQNVSDRLVSVLDKLQRPLVFYSDLSTYRQEHRMLSRELLTRLPDHHGLIYQVNDQQQLMTLFELLRDKRQRLKQDKVVFKQLKLTNIGVYQELTVDFNQRLTVLIGVNGAGKSTILKALAIGVLGPNLAASADLLRIESMMDDKTQWQTKGEIQLIAEINGEQVTNIIKLEYNAIIGDFIMDGQAFAAMFDHHHDLRQLILGIGEQRSTLPSTAASKQYFVRPTGLSPRKRDLSTLISGEKHSCIADFSQWLSHLAFDVSQGKQEKQGIIDSCFAVFSALMGESIQFAGLTGVEPAELWIEHQQPRQQVPLRLASQGYRAVMGWIGFILQRMYEAYDQALLPLQQPAIILIDEIDQLLHIKWQQKILDVLAKQFFPNTQWIVTTHSPMVINALDQDEVRQLHERNGQLVAEQSPVDLWSWQYGDVVNHLFKVPPTPPKIQRDILRKQIKQLEAMSETENDPHQLERLYQNLIRLEASLAYVDEVEQERQRLQKREQELSDLIAQLKSQTQQKPE